MNKTPSIASMPGAPDADGDEAAPAKPDPYQAKADMLTLMEAHKIKSNKARHAAAKAMARQHLAQVTKVVKGD